MMMSSRSLLSSLVSLAGLLHVAQGLETLPLPSNLISLETRQGERMLVRLKALCAFATFLGLSSSYALKSNIVQAFLLHCEKGRTLSFS